jgi:hypothetical protein
MERDERRRDAGSPELAKHRFVEVQPRRRRRCRTRMARIDRLSARRDRGAGGTRDGAVRRHVAVTLEIIEKRAGASRRRRKNRPSRSTTVACASPGSSSFPRASADGRAKLEHRLVPATSRSSKSSTVRRSVPCVEARLITRR